MMKNSEKRELVRSRLLDTSGQLCSKDDQSRLGLALRSHVPNLTYAFILDCVPDQAEDIYWVMISPKDVVKIEVPRDRSRNERAILLEIMNVAMFRKNRRSRDAREKLKIALELIDS